MRLFLMLYAAVCIVLCAAGADAHAPFLEEADLSPEAPFVMQGTVEKSIAVYASLESDDVDVYTFTVAEGERVQANVLVPQCMEYQGFYPALALVGPGLPDPEQPLPLTLPSGFGARVQRGSLDNPPDVFYEPFSRKSYFRFPHLVHENAEPGLWQAWIWDPGGAAGDYVAAIGFRERFNPGDIMRTLFILPLLWFDGELHGPCTEP